MLGNGKKRSPSCGLPDACTAGQGCWPSWQTAKRGLGRPEKAIELSRAPEAKELDADQAIELAIVAAGARLDQGQADSAVITLQRANPDRADRGMAAVRLSYAYANALLEAGRRDEAVEWFDHAAAIDEEEWTDAEERLAELEEN